MPFQVSRRRPRQSAGTTMMVAVVAVVVAKPSAAAAAVPVVPLPTVRTPAPAKARPARLAMAISPNMGPCDITAIAGTAPKVTPGSTEATVFITGAAVAQPCGTDSDPTRVARPIDPATPPVSGVTAET